MLGTASRVADLLASYRERIGLDLLIVRSSVPGISREESESALERLAGDVMPRLVT